MIQLNYIELLWSNIIQLWSENILCMIWILLNLLISIYLILFNLFWEMMKDREAWHAAAHGMARNQTWLSDWTTTKSIDTYFMALLLNHILSDLSLCCQREIWNIINLIQMLSKFPTKQESSEIKGINLNYLTIESYKWVAKSPESALFTATLCRSYDSSGNCVK